MYFEIDRIKRLLDELKEQIYTHKKILDGVKYRECDYGDYNLLQEDASNWAFFEKEQRWGGRDRHSWFRLQAQIPEEMAGQQVVFEVETGAEEGWDALNPQFLVYVDGKIIQGFDVNHRNIVLAKQGEPGAIYNLDLYAYSGMEKNTVKLTPSIAVRHGMVEKLYYDIRVPLEVADLLDGEDKRRFDILNYLTEAVNLIDFRRPHSPDYFESVNSAVDYLEKAFYQGYCAESDIIEHCIGHTHIDVAWLWTLAQTREKTARSFGTVLNLMKEYPEYQFMSSQPQLYQYLKEDQPELYAQVKERVKEGRWEAEGAMWLEADANLTSGESLVRQIIHGKRFFREEFGVDSKILWLPDVFGYSAALPQILRKSGVDYFMTTKISWNEYNQIPYDTFYWQGIDGSQVFTHFISTREFEKGGGKDKFTTYNGETSPLFVKGCWQRYQQKDMNSEVLNCFGHGDGGGGPTRDMLENIRRLERGIPGAPTVKYGKAYDYFKDLETRIGHHKRMPKWVGELYLEYHRGTYTSMARNKKGNRTAERMNIDAEWLASFEGIVTGEDRYPKEALRSCWEKTLLNQFHDIIPGSSIKEVYDDSKRDYKELEEVTGGFINDSMTAIVGALDVVEDSVVVFNGLGFERSDVVTVELPESYGAVVLYDGDGRVNSQRNTDGQLIFFAENVPSKGYKTFRIESCGSQQSCDDFGTISSERIETPFFKITLDEKGSITSLYDRVQARQVLKNGEKANVLQAFEDKPHNFDAWDINIYYLEKMWLVDDVTEIKVVEDGPVRKGLKIRRQFLDSTIDQILYVYRDIPRIDFKTHIDWKESQVLLKAAFPVDVLASKASYEIQYGNVERPTHWNTSWDYARFEVCAHKWADISEDGYGVSLLNDCKYGHDIKDSTMRLSLLKSAKEPNEHADRETHEFTYSLYPHAGDFKEGGVVQMAHNLNNPMYGRFTTRHEGRLPGTVSMVKVDKENVIIEVVKKAEEGDDLIVRLYECYNRRSKVKCELFFAPSMVVETDLLENELQSVSCDGNSFEFDIKPYEIKTFRIKKLAI